MAYYSSFSELKKALKAEGYGGAGGFISSEAKKTIEEQVVPDIKNKFLENIKKYVLDAYKLSSQIEGEKSKNKHYERRAAGGIDDPANILSTVTENTLGMEVFITNVAPPSPSLKEPVFKEPIPPHESRLMQWIEFGCVPNIFNSRKNYPWMKPRRAVAETQKYVDTDTALREKVKNALMG